MPAVPPTTRALLILGELDMMDGYVDGYVDGWMDISIDRLMDDMPRKLIQCRARFTLLIYIYLMMNGVEWSHQYHA